MSESLYLLKADILSVHPCLDGRKDYLYVPAGTIVSVGNRNTEVGPFVEVRWDAKTVLMFPQDLEERAEAIPAQPYSGAAQVRAATALGFSR